MRASEERFRSLVQNSSDLTMVMDTTGQITYASEASIGLLGRSPEELVGGAVRRARPPGRHLLVAAQLSAELGVMTTAAPLELRVRHADGTWRYVEAVVANLLDRPSVAGIVINARDLTERKRVEAALEHQALHDVLTGLPNRLLFLDRLEQAIARASREHATPAVMFLDLDRFKLVNDGLGHDVGDQLLVGVAERLRGALRPGDTVARFGGDEFVLLFEGLSTPEAADVLARRMLACFAKPFPVGGEQFQASASLGMALGDGTKTAGELVRDADAAMYRAKALGRGRLQLFDAMTQDEVAPPDAHGNRAAGRPRPRRAATALSTDLRAGRGSPGRRRGARALGAPHSGPPGAGRVHRRRRGQRAHRPHRRLGAGRGVPPGARLERGARRGPSAQAQRQPLGPPAGRAGAVGDGEGHLAGCGDRSRRLHLSLEITEALVLHDPETAALRLGELRALGVQFAIDDFGTGYSSLAYLRRFPVSIVKVDSPFVAGLGIDDHDEAIVSAIVRLAHTLGLQVVAEGVETELQLAHLRAMGCDYAQGFLLGRPEPPERMDLLSSGVFANQASGPSPSTCERR